MNIIPKFPGFRNTESLQFFTDVVDICKKNDVQKLKLTDPLARLEQNNRDLSASFKVMSGSDLTEMLTHCDQRRDDAVVCLRKVADGYTNHHKPELRQAGLKILQTIDKYGGSIQKLNYQSQTSTTDNLCKDLKSAPIAATVEAIGMTEVVAEMEEANRLFSDTYLRRIQESANNDQIATGQLIQEAIHNFRTLVAHIKAYNVITPSDDYTSLLKQISELTDKYNSLVSNRAKKDNEEAPQEDVN